MRNKISKILSRTIFIVSGVLTAVFLKITNALAQGFDPNTMVVYSPPEVFACGDNKLCLLLYGLRRSWVFVVIVLLVLLAIIFGIVKTNCGWQSICHHVGNFSQLIKRSGFDLGFFNLAGIIGRKISDVNVIEQSIGQASFLNDIVY